MKEITIQIPDNKTIEWVDGTMRLVDEKPPVMERIKTFDDAYKELGENHPLVIRYNCVLRIFKRDPMTKDLIAYLKLCIIAAALNEGWEPKFEKGECRYSPWFYKCSKEQYNKLDDKEKRLYIFLSDHNMFISIGVGISYTNTYSVCGSRFIFNTRELAFYAGKQFTEEFLQFYNRI